MEFFVIGILSFFIILIFALTRYIAIAIIPANANIRSNLFRCREFEEPLSFFIVTLANQSIVWSVEENLPEPMLSLLDCSR